MTKFLKQKLNIVFLCIIVLGLLITSLTFVYYGFHLGIEPCKGLATDAANCGDADLGGVGFILIGVPIILLGVIGLVIKLVWGYIKRKR